MPLSAVRALEIDYDQQAFQVRGTDLVFRAGDLITLDGSTGEVFRGQVPTSAPKVESPAFKALMTWGGGPPATAARPRQCRYPA